jgi:hypothetical protein
MTIRILDIAEITKPIASPIRNAYINFSKMTTSLVAVVTNIERNGKRVVGYGFNSNGRYGQGELIRERFRPRLLEAKPDSLLNDAADNLDPDKCWDAMMQNEKPGGHGERSVVVLLALSGHRLVRCTCLLLTQSGHVSVTALQRGRPSYRRSRGVAALKYKARQSCRTRCRHR